MKQESRFEKDIVEFNKMYKMRVSDAPTLNMGLPLVRRLLDFKNILRKELNEIDDIIAKAQAFMTGEAYIPLPPAPAYHPDELEILTDLADLLGDIQVYCASEMAKFGLPLGHVLNIIMESNFSKMGADGKPIYDEENKLQKGPNYWKPEPKISRMLENLILFHKQSDLFIKPAAAFGAFDPLPLK